ncbi:MAG: hypothetical protein ABT20_11140 [Rubrivivax sp. SCN 70-15]|nr:MAG: hypothetical protein ABT20_11140 [Rubrivivax sp. SCN 70-15]
MPEASSFLSRWSRRKAQAKDGTAPAEPVPAPAPEAEVPAASAAEPLPQVPVAVAQTPAPTLADVHLLTRESDYSRFVAADVDATVKNAALKQLFGDPHFNVMDGLDTYIDDYNLPDPLPRAMLRRIAQNPFLGLLAEPEEPARVATPAAAPPESPPDEDPDLRLQPDDGARRPGAGPGADEDPGREP